MKNSLNSFLKSGRKVGNEFDTLSACDISIPVFSENSVPKVRIHLKNLKTNKAIVKDDIPAKVIILLAN